MTTQFVSSAMLNEVYIGCHVDWFHHIRTARKKMLSAILVLLACSHLVESQEVGLDFEHFYSSCIVIKKKQQLVYMFIERLV